MFLKTIVKTDTKTGKRYEYLRLCESYRIGKNTRHKTVLSLGEIASLDTSELKKCFADRLERLISGKQQLFVQSLPPDLEVLANKLYKKYKEKTLQEQPIKSNLEANKTAEKDFETIDLNSIETDDVKEIGSEWLCFQALKQLGLGHFLYELGNEKKDVQIALVHIIAKAVYPSSEHRAIQWIQDNSAVAELFGVESQKITRYHLYEAARDLYSQKDAIESYLSKKTNELFDIEDKIILYDLTNTYFEGRKKDSDVAKFGRSKEKRSDAKLLTLALVTNAEGFVKHSKIFAGNIADCKTLETMVTDLSVSTSQVDRKPLVVIDAGIATEENLAMLKNKGYDYLCVTRSKLKNYTVCNENTPATQISDRKGNLIEIQLVKPQIKESKFEVEAEAEAEKDAKQNDTFLYVRSEQKGQKEASMENRFSQRLEEELEHLSNGLSKKGTTKKLEKVCERLGRIKERYAYAAKFYTIEIQSADGLATKIIWTKKDTKPSEYQGVYFLRSSRQELKEKDLWAIYNTLTEIEATFRILKTDLCLRPVHHKSDANCEAHLFLGVLAYAVVATIRYQLKQKGINDSWTNIVRKMNTQKRVITTMTNNKNQRIFITTCSKPIHDATLIYDALKFKHTPFQRKKFVLPE